MKKFSVCAAQSLFLQNMSSPGYILPLPPRALILKSADRQWAIKVAETLSEIDTFRYSISYFIYFACRVNSVMRPGRQFNVVKVLWSVQS